MGAGRMEYSGKLGIFHGRSLWKAAPKHLEMAMNGDLINKYQAIRDIANDLDY